MASKFKIVSNISRKITYFHTVGLFAVYVAFSLIVGGPGILHTEMDARLPAHISGKPILQIIFDANAMNLGGWEARQLSFLFDIIDGNFVAFCIRQGIPHFRSITHYLFTLVIVLYVWHFFTRILRLDRLLSLLLIALLLTTPSFIYPYYYRTSKIGVSLLVIILLGEIYKIIRGETYINQKIMRPLWLALAFLLTTLALMLFDVLGGLFATVIIAYLFFAFLYKPERSKLAALAGMAAGYIIWLLYFAYLGPALMYAITGQSADTSYLTSVPLSYFVVVFLLGIPSLLIDMTRYLFGYFPFPVAIILLGCIIGVSVWLTIKPKQKARTTIGSGTLQSEQPAKDIASRARSFIKRYEPALSLIFLLVGLALIYDLLVTRHPPILWPDVRPNYYIMPAQAALLLGTATLLARSRVKWMCRLPHTQILVTTILFFCLLGNITGSIMIKDVLFSGDSTRLYSHDASLVDALRQIDQPGFHPDNAVASDPIYLMFSKP